MDIELCDFDIELDHYKYTKRGCFFTAPFCILLFPYSFALANIVIQVIFHSHNFLERNTLEDFHLHFDLNPDSRIYSKNYEAAPCQKPYHKALMRVAWDIENHIYCSNYTDYWEDNSTWHFEVSRCIWKAFSENQ